MGYVVQPGLELTHNNPPFWFVIPHPASWLLHFLNITFDKKKKKKENTEHFSQILQVVWKWTMCLLVEEETYSLGKDAIEIILNSLEFIVYMQGIPMIGISKGSLLVRPHDPLLGFVKMKR